MIESATFESSEYDLPTLGDRDLRLSPGEFLGLGDGVRLISGGLFVGDGDRFALSGLAAGFAPFCGVGFGDGETLRPTFGGGEGVCLPGLLLYCKINKLLG